MATSISAPTKIVLHARSKLLEVEFEDGGNFRLTLEFLRVWSPSAEVRGHGPGQEVLQAGKRNVAVLAIDPVGNYGVQPHFDDGHDTGIYSWEYLRWLCDHQEELWTDYVNRLEAAGLDRDHAVAAPPPARKH